MLTASLGGSVHGAALLWLQARLPSYHPVVTWLPPLFPRRRAHLAAGVCGAWGRVFLAGYHPYQACAGRGIELGNLGAVEVLGKVLLLPLNPTLALPPTP